MLLATQDIDRSAAVGASYASAAAGGDTFEPGHGTFMHVRNASGVSVTVTVAAYALVLPNVPVLARQVVVAAGGERMMGPWPRAVFMNPATGLIHVSYSAVTSVTVAVLQPVSAEAMVAVWEALLAEDGDALLSEAGIPLALEAV